LAGINGIGFESGNDLMTDGRDIPWLQDITSEDVWTSWEVVYRDVVILDADNHIIDTYNLTSHSLGTTANYEEFKNLLLAAAGAAIETEVEE
jgi:hypothetical protein